jgi:hypothetical protein
MAAIDRVLTPFCSTTSGATALRFEGDRTRERLGGQLPAAAPPNPAVRAAIAARYGLELADDPPSAG